MGSLRVSADRESCVTSSLCVYRLPQVFDQDAEGRVLVVDEQPPDGLLRELQRARRGCPTRSIRLEGPGVEPDEAGEATP
ncbi:ferredoxin [Kitasatospora sp. MMS16-BH015]|uniref:ferredoxin n=1 Tax=Kitasatospora sp. MMS16-BH015 TaxID=2018025 RepID=UPI000CA0A371|nr:ferredoxin [Kitasatospora sp. MMS16-BH015]AUG78922.1 ferredoxin [Kitasatospora sp. MMS16-BH015]